MVNNKWFNIDAGKDALEVVVATLREYNLGDLSDEVWKMLTEGYTQDRIWIELQETPTWKRRFQGNELRRRAGLAVLSPAEYLSVEASYRQIMESAGLPKGFYDKPSDFANWIGKNVAPTEVKSRVDAAVNFVNQAPEEARRAMRASGFTDGELYAWALDQKKTEKMVVDRFRSAELQGRLTQSGAGNLSRQTADRIAAVAGENTTNRQAIDTTARLAEQGGALAAIYGERYDLDRAARDVFMQDVQAGAVRRRLASQERAAFSGRAGVGDKSLSRRTRT